MLCYFWKESPPDTQTTDPLKNLSDPESGDFPLDIAVLNVVFAVVVWQLTKDPKFPQLVSVLLSEDLFSYVQGQTFSHTSVEIRTFPLQVKCIVQSPKMSRYCHTTVLKNEIVLGLTTFSKEAKSSRCTSRLKCIYISASDIIQLLQHR